jgi:hypothetical protein
MYAFIPKWLINFQNCFGVVFRLYRGKCYGYVLTWIVSGFGVLPSSAELEKQFYGGCETVSLLKRVKLLEAF